MSVVIRSGDYEAIAKWWKEIDGGVEGLREMLS